MSFSIFRILYISPKAGYPGSELIRTFFHENNALNNLFSLETIQHKKGIEIPKPSLLKNRHTNILAEKYFSQKNNTITQLIVKFIAINSYVLPRNFDEFPLVKFRCCTAVIKH